jgi:AP-1 complex subunit mu
MVRKKKGEPPPPSCAHPPASPSCCLSHVFSFFFLSPSVYIHYFGTLEEEALRDNFVIAHELLDETADAGHPQFTEGAILGEYIKTGSAAAALLGSLVGEAVQARPPAAVTGAVSWRREGIRYKKNEVFLDVVERVNAVVSASGAAVRSEVVGALRMRAYLSGMPECKLGLNDKALFDAVVAAEGGAGGASTPAPRAGRGAVDLEDVKFHQCVRLARFGADRTIAFVPPDGAFDLMTYRLAAAVKPLIVVECTVSTRSRSTSEFLVRARAAFKERSTATGVEIAVPLPPDATAPVVRASAGAAVYEPARAALVWRIKAFPGGKEHVLRCRVSLPSVQAEDAATAAAARPPPIRVKFEIPYFTVSGLQVRYLKVVDKSGYQALPWVRYITEAGEYEVRMPGGGVGGSAGGAARAAGA